MSLSCGACRETVYDDFALLYKLERSKDGNLVYPQAGKNDEAKNSVVCAECWQKVPEKEKKAGAEARARAEQSGKDVFAYAEADSPNARGVGWKTSIGMIVNRDKEDLVFVETEVVARYLPQAIEVIETFYV